MCLVVEKLKEEKINERWRFKKKIYSIFLLKNFLCGFFYDIEVVFKKIGIKFF